MSVMDRDMNVKFINLALLAIPVCITAILFAILIRIISFMRKSIDKLQHEIESLTKDKTDNLSS